MAWEAASERAVEFWFWELNAMELELELDRSSGGSDEEEEEEGRRRVLLLRGGDADERNPLWLPSSISIPVRSALIFGSSGGCKVRGVRWWC